MNTPSSDSSNPLINLVTYLFTQREVILNNWRTACEQDPTLGKVSTLSREEFNNLLPIVLDILDERLLNKTPQADTTLTAHAHGLHRWHKAHSLMETMQELAHLTQILNNEVDTYQALFPQTDASLIGRVMQQVGQIMTATLQGSVAKYDELQRLEAAARSATLQKALEQMEQLTRQRGDMLRTSSHDLRGSFGIINSAAYLLRMEGLDEEERVQYLDMMSRNLANVESMLSNLMNLSRLEAGQEAVVFQSVDAAQLLRELVDSAQPMAAERGLSLRAQGPDSLLVETDPVKLQRIAQNLLLNALKYTPAGFVSVSWSWEGDARWIFSIQDSGPGLPNNLTGLLAQQLKPTVEPTSTLSPDQAEPVTVLPSVEQELPDSQEIARLGSQLRQGEGVGLQIVKRLCDLLDANLDIETLEGRGSLFRVGLPIRQGH